MFRNKTGYSTSDLISRLYTGCFLPYNFHPKNLSQETNQEKIDIFFNIGSFNNLIYLCQYGFCEKYKIIQELNFDKDFKNALKTEKAKKAADFYPLWFQICCHLKFLFGENGLNYFKLFSALSEKYSEKECEKFYENCNPAFGFIPGIFSILGKYMPPEPELDRKSLIKKTFFPETKN